MYIPEITTGYLKINTDQMIEVDRLMTDDYRIELIQMMENAGRCLAITAREKFLSGDPQGRKVAVLAGNGGNGGGAMVAARRLAGWGAEVDLFIATKEDRMTPVPLYQLNILKRMGVPIQATERLPDPSTYHLILDGIIGYSVKGDPHGNPRLMIEWANRVSTPVLSLDTPSGLELTTGTVHAPTVKAHATLTLAMPKQGLFNSKAKEYVGDLYLGDIR